MPQSDTAFRRVMAVIAAAGPVVACISLFFPLHPDRLPARSTGRQANAEQGASGKAVQRAGTAVMSEETLQAAAPMLSSATHPILLESIVGESVEGRPIERWQIGTGDYVILLLASIHGNEAAGTPLLQRLANHVQQNPELLDGATVILLPAVNPDGVVHGSRYNAHGVDLNRNFPAANRQNSQRYGMEALSEPEALVLYRTIAEFLPSHIITLHEPLQCVDYDGPAAQLAAAISEVCPLPVKKLGSRPGSLGSYAGVTLGIPTITLELPKNAAHQSVDLLWNFYGSALVASIRYRQR